MSFIEERLLERLPMTICPVGAELLSAFGVETDSLRVYEYRKEKFIHIINKTSHRTFKYKDLPVEAINKIAILNAAKKNIPINRK